LEVASNGITIYEHPQRFEDKSEFYFELMPGFWARIRFLYSFWNKRVIPDFHAVRTNWVPKKRKSFMPITRKKFKYHVGKTPEEVKGILLRRMQRELKHDINEGVKAQAALEADIKQLTRLRKRAQKFERSINEHGNK
jgi:hypothetical protein